MKKVICILAAVLLLALGLSACKNNPPSGETNTPPSGTQTPDETLPPSNPDKGDNMNSEILVVYFSCTNTTKTIADYIIEKTGGTGYRIQPEVPYTTDDLKYYTNGRADREQADSGARPAISGVRLIDTAYIYGNEAEVGQAVRESGIPREEIFVITKIYLGTQFSNPEKAIQDALDKLDIGYIDIMLLHHPGTNDVKAYKAIEKFVEQGKIRSIGLSNWYVEEIDDFIAQVNIKPALVQNEIHPYYQEKTVVPYMHNLGIVMQAWYPFGGRGHTGAMLSDETIVGIANAHNVTAAQVILRWHLQRGVVAIPGSSDTDHIKENISVFGFELTESEMQSIAALDANEKHDWY